MRKCAICGEKDHFTYPLPQLLKDLGYNDGVYAHPSCITNEQKVRGEYKRRFGVDMPKPTRRL